MVLSVPAMGAWDIPTAAPQTATFAVPQPQSNWTTTLVPAPTVNAEVQAQVATAAVAAQGAWVERTQATAVVISYVKSEEDARVLNQSVTAGPYAVPIPEPGSIAGLSTALVGLFLHVRRIRKRS